MELEHLRERFPAAPEDIYTRILMEAGVRFQRDGYAETPVAAIASALDITPAALYWHFESKEEILFTFLVRAHETFEFEMEAAIPATGDPVDRLRRLAYASTYIRIAGLEISQVDTSQSIGTLARSLSPDRVKVLRVMARTHFDRCRTIIEEGMTQGVFTVPDAVTATFAITTMCESVSLWYQEGGRLTIAEIAQAYETYALGAVGYLQPATAPLTL